MTLTDIRRAVAADTSLSQAEVDQVVDAVLEQIASALVAGDKVTLAGFGTFETRHRAARSGRNPQTGEALEIAASTSAGFKAAAPLKRRLND